MSDWLEDQYLPGATIPRGGTARNHKTGNWRTASLPRFSSTLCEACPRPTQACATLSQECSIACNRDCLLCWVSCPDACIGLEDGRVWGINLDYCKGCGICAEVCPRGAIVMISKGEAM